MGAGRLTAKNGGFRPGQFDTGFPPAVMHEIAQKVTWPRTGDEAILMPSSIFHS
jgi:hypothetical protein